MQHERLRIEFGKAKAEVSAGQRSMALAIVAALIAWLGWLVL